MCLRSFPACGPCPCPPSRRAGSLQAGTSSGAHQGRARSGLSLFSSQKQFLLYGRNGQGHLKGTKARVPPSSPPWRTSGRSSCVHRWLCLLFCRAPPTGRLECSVTVTQVPLTLPNSSAVAGGRPTVTKQVLSVCFRLPSCFSFISYSLFLN